MKQISRAVWLAAVLASASSATTILTLNPTDGALFGQPGQAVGWGFTIVDDTFSLTVAGTDFCTSFNTSPQPDLFPCGNPVPNGTYLDFTEFNFVQSAPGMADTSQQNFSYNPPCGTLGPCTGTGAFTIDADNALIGTLLRGVIVVDYNLDDGIGGDHFITAPASVLVVSQVVPEPGTVSLMGAALAGMVLWRRRARATEKIV
jgi:hypothetical protein